MLTLHQPLLNLLSNSNGCPVDLDFPYTQSRHLSIMTVLFFSSSVREVVKEGTPDSLPPEWKNFHCFTIRSDFCCRYSLLG